MGPEQEWVNLSETVKTAAETVATSAASSTKRVTWRDRVGEGRELFRVVDDIQVTNEPLKPLMPTAPKMPSRRKPNRDQWTKIIHTAGCKKALPMKTQNMSLSTQKDVNSSQRVESPGGFEVDVDDIPLSGFGGPSKQSADSHPEEQAVQSSKASFNQEIPYKKIKKPTRSVHQIINQRGAGWRILARAPPTESTSLAMSETLRSTTSSLAPMSELTAFLPPSYRKPRTGKRVFAQSRLASHGKESTIFPGRVFQETMQAPESTSLGWRAVFPPSAILKHSRCYSKDSTSNTRSFVNSNSMPPAGCMTVR